MSTDKRPSVPAALYTEEYFRGACEGFDEFNESQGERLSRRLQAAFRLAQVRAGMRVLDIGCGRGEILRRCATLGADAVGIDYAPVAMSLTREVIASGMGEAGAMTVSQADAKRLPFPAEFFDRALMYDVVEHLYAWELDAAMAEVRRVLKPDGLFVIHTAPNAWYDRFAYPFVRAFRRLSGQGSAYPENPRALNVAANVEVHVNEQSGLSLWRTLRRNGFRGKVWLESPPQNRSEKPLLALLRRVFFGLPPFRWFFEREVFAVAGKR